MMQPMCVSKSSIGILLALGLVEPASAGRIGDLFSDGLFGLQWGATPERIEAVHPEGKWEQMGPLRVYWVTDNRAVLNVERGKKSRLGFALSSDARWNSVTVEFVPGDTNTWGEILLKSQEAFGPIRRPDLQHMAIAGTVTVEWEEDAGVKVVAYNTPGMTKSAISLSVSKINWGEPKGKEELGFK